MTIINILSQLQMLVQAILLNVIPALTLVGILWAVALANVLLNKRLLLLGIMPRRWYGIPGIFISPFLHGDFNHLFFNSIPLFVLSDFMMLAGKHEFYVISIFIIVVSGLLTWLFGRRAIHVGASALILGYFGYLLFIAYQHPGVNAIVLVIVMLYYFGGLAASLIPTEERVSWEGHVFGFVAGLLAAYFTPWILG